MDDGRWHFIVVRYEGSALSLGVDDINASISISGEIDNAMNRPLLIASGQNTAYFPGKMDEVKIFAVALGDDEIATLKANDLAGNDYIGLPRPAVECGATIGGGTWEMLGIPADFRNSSNTKNTVADIFGDDMSGTYMTDWRVYRRDYNVTDNNSSYELLSTSDTLDFGAGYWLGSKLSSNWSENGAVSVDYNSTTNGTNECPATRCVEIKMTPISKNFEAPDNDPNDGTGPYRYFMTGFTGKAPVDWLTVVLLLVMRTVVTVKY